MQRRVIFYLCSSLILFLLAGCASINASSRDHLSSDQSTLILSTDADTIQDALRQEFEARGYQRISRHMSEDATIVKFKGARITHTSGTADGVASSTIGSVFFARIEPASDTKSTVILFGKPTIDDHEICSDDDWKDTSCETMTTGIGWSGRDMVVGRHEAETIQSVLLSLEDRVKAREGSSSLSN